MAGSPVKKKRPGRFLLKAALTLLVYYLIVPPFLVPVSGTVTSGFFIRSAPEEIILPSMEFHGGVDIAAAGGSGIKASKSGKVIAAGFSPAGGNHVEIRHWLGFSTYYAHLDRISVKKGAYILKGFRIGTVGSSGRSTGPHLHFEVRFLGMKVPPGIFYLIESLRTGVFRWIVKK